MAEDYMGEDYMAEDYEEKTQEQLMKEYFEGVKIRKGYNCIDSSHPLYPEYQHFVLMGTPQEWKDFLKFGQQRREAYLRRNGAIFQHRYEFSKRRFPAMHQSAC